MSLTASAVIELPPDSASSDTSSGPKFERKFLVTFTSSSYLALASALTASAGGTSIPLKDDVWPDTVADYAPPTVRSIRAAFASQSTQTRVIVTVEYSLERGGAAQSQSEVPPWEEDPVYSSDFRSETRPMEYDKTSPTPKRVCNAAGDTFDPQPEEELTSEFLTITRATLNYSRSTARSLRGTINASAKTIAGASVSAKLARLLRWNGTTATWTDSSGAVTDYYQETLEIEIRSAAFTLSLINQGYGYLVGSDYYRGVDSDGNAWARPRLLNADGTLATTTSANTIDFEPYPTGDWSALGSL